MSIMLNEFVDKKNIIVEAPIEGKTKHFYMNGIFIQADVRNMNERIYPLHEIQNAVKNLQNRIVNGESVLGEADHPDTLTINIDRISHSIESMRMENNNGIGKLKVLNTVSGKIIQDLLREDIKLGVSSRGAGSVDSDGYVSDFEIVTVDIVVQPSAPNAYPVPIYESIFGTRQGNILANVTQGVMNNDKIASLHAEKELTKFINQLRIS